MLSLLAYFRVLLDVCLLPYQALQRVQSNEMEAEPDVLYQPKVAKPLRSILWNHFPFVASVHVRFRYFLLL